MKLMFKFQCILNILLTFPGHISQIDLIPYELSYGFIIRFVFTLDVYFVIRYSGKCLTENSI